MLRVSFTRVEESVPVLSVIHNSSFTCTKEVEHVTDDRVCAPFVVIQWSERSAMTVYGKLGEKHKRKVINKGPISQISNYPNHFRPHFEAHILPASLFVYLVVRSHHYFYWFVAETINLTTCARKLIDFVISKHNKASRKILTKKLADTDSITHDTVRLTLPQSMHIIINVISRMIFSTISGPPSKILTKTGIQNTQSHKRVQQKSKFITD